MATWHTPTTIRNWWSGAPSNISVLDVLLGIAKDQVLAKAPALADDVANDEIPERYVYVQYRRARELWESQKGDALNEDVEGGLEGFRTRASRGYLSQELVNILRPPAAVPRIG